MTEHSTIHSTLTLERTYPVARHEVFAAVDIAYTSLYRDIVDGERIVYTSVLTSDGRTATLSLTTISSPTRPTGRT